MPWRCWRRRCIRSFCEIFQLCGCMDFVDESREADAQKACNRTSESLNFYEKRLEIYPTGVYNADVRKNPKTK